MGESRKSREFVLQMFYSIDISKLSCDETLRLFWFSNPGESAEVRGFTERIVRGVVEKGTDIDSAISSYSANWKISRMTAVDRNVLRLAIYELRWCDDIPAKVTLNEAIEIAKQYRTEESGAFVNGILDKIAKIVAKE